MGRKKIDKNYKKERLNLAKDSVRIKFGARGMSILRKKNLQENEKQREIILFLIESGFKQREVANLAKKSPELVSYILNKKEKRKTPKMMFFDERWIEEEEEEELGRTRNKSREDEILDDFNGKNLAENSVKMSKNLNEKESENATEKQNNYLAEKENRIVDANNIIQNIVVGGSVAEKNPVGVGEEQSTEKKLNLLIDSEENLKAIRPEGSATEGDAIPIKIVEKEEAKKELIEKKDEIEEFTTEAVAQVESKVPDETPASIKVLEVEADKIQVDPNPESADKPSFWQRFEKIRRPALLPTLATVSTILAILLTSFTLLYHVGEKKDRVAMNKAFSDKIKEAIFGGDLAGNLQNAKVLDDSHQHSAETLAEHDSLKGAGTIDTKEEIEDLVVNGDLKKGSVDDIQIKADSHTHTGKTVSEIDVSADTNLKGDHGISVDNDTLNLSKLTRDWNQTGKYDIVLNDKDSELKILESNGSAYGTIDVGDISENSTYTVSGPSGDILTSTQFEEALNPTYVNVTGDTMTGNLNVLADLGIGTTSPSNQLSIIGSADISHRLGINTPNPSEALDVNGNILIAGGGTIDVRSAGTLLVGGSTQTGLTLGRSGAVTTLSGLSLVVNPTAWTATPTISGLITATSGITANGTLTANSNLTANLGATITGAVINLNASSNFATNINTGTSTGTVTIGSGLNLISLSSSDWGISNAGSLSGISGIANDGAYTQTGVSANTFTGTSTFSNATYSALFTGGNVGIGTATPTYKLDVTGTGRFTGALAVGGALTVTGDLLPSANDTYSLGSDTMRWANAWLGAETIHVGTTDADEGEIGYDTTNNVMTVQSNGNLALQASSGNVGIGTTAPGSYKLSVSGNTYATNTLEDSGNNLLTYQLFANTRSNTTNYYRGSLAQVYADNDGYTNSGYIKGFEGAALIRDSGTTNSVYGASFTAGNFGPGGSDPLATINSLYGANFSLYNMPLSTVGNVYGNYIELPTQGTITNGIHGVYIVGNSLASGTNKYGVYIGGMSGATNNYGVYSAGGTNYFADNLGIGTTAPTYKLDVTGTGRFTGALTVGGALTMTGDLLPSANDTYNLGSDTMRWANAWLGAETIHVGTADADEGEIGYDTTNNVMTVQSNGNLALQSSSGNVGIGTTGPGAKLEVRGNGLISDAIDPRISGATLTLSELTDASQQIVGAWGNITSQLHLRYPASTDGMGSGISFGVSANNEATGAKIVHVRTGSNSVGDLAFFTRSDTDDGSDLTTEKVRIKSTGNVGIGTTSPGSKLEVNIGDVSTLGAFSNLGMYLAGGGYAGNIQQIGFGYKSGQTYTPSAIGQIVTTASGYTSGALIFATRNVTTDTQPSERMRIDSGGNVGIGTTGPGAKLDILSSNVLTNTSGNLYVHTSDAQAIDLGGQITLGGSYTDAGGQTRFAAIAGRKENGVSGNAPGYLVFSTSNYSGGALTEKMRISSAGNVGIGTTNPAGKLEVVSDVSAGMAAIKVKNISTTAGSTSGFYGLVSNGAAGFALYGDSAVTADSPYNVHLRAYQGSASLQFHSGNSATPQMLLSSGGNLGIGTTNPGTKLDVQGSIRSSTGNAGYYADFIAQENSLLPFKLDVQGGTVLSYGDGTADNGGVVFLNAYKAGGTNRGIALQYAGSTKLYVSSSGNVGIGTTAPIFTLDVAGAIRSQTGVLYLTDSNTRIEDSSDMLQLIGSSGLKLRTNNGTWGERLRVDSSGNVGIGTTAPTYKLDVYGTIAGHSELILGGIEHGAGMGYGLISGKDSSGNTQFRVTASGNYGSNSYFNANGGNVGIGTTAPSSVLDIDTSSNTTGLRLRGLAEAVEIGDIYMNAGGAMILSTLNGTGSTGYVDIRGEDDLYGLILRDSSGVNSTVFSNFYVNDAATDYLNINVNTSNATAGLVVQAGGNVGIGTTGPGYKLSVSTATQYGGINLTNGTNSIVELVGWGAGNDNGTILLKNSGTANVFLTASGNSYINTGNVGIGTTSPSTKLYVSGGGVAITDATGANSGQLLYAANTTTTGTNYGAVLQASGSGAANNTGIYATASGATNNYGVRIVGPSSGATSWAIYSDATAQSYFAGNVGIGTTSPQYPLSLQYSNSSGGIAETGLIVKNTSTNNSAQIQLISSRSWSVMANGALGGPANGFSIVDNVAGQTRMAIDTNGNVGIGTTAPGTYKLNIAGTGYLGASAWVYSSDERLKENISYFKDVPTTGSLSKILRLQPARYDYKVGEKNQIGFIAQDVQKVIPEAAVVTDATTGILGLKTDFIIPYLVGATQEQNIEVQRIVAEVASQKLEVESLTVEVDNTKLQVEGIDTRLATIEASNTAQETTLEELERRLAELEEGSLMMVDGSSTEEEIFSPSAEGEYPEGGRGLETDGIIDPSASSSDSSAPPLDEGRKIDGITALSISDQLQGEIIANLNVKNLTVIENIIVAGDIKVEGHIIAGEDTAGELTIDPEIYETQKDPVTGLDILDEAGQPVYKLDEAGQKIPVLYKKVEFKRPYGAVPIINLTPIGEVGLDPEFRYAITEKSATGFTVKINRAFSTSVKFDWQVLGR